MGSIPITRSSFSPGCGGAELDLLILHRGRRYGFEMKFADAPSVTRSMHVALADLQLDRFWVIYPGRRSYRLSEKIYAAPLGELQTWSPQSAA